MSNLLGGYLSATFNPLSGAPTTVEYLVVAGGGGGGTSLSSSGHHGTSAANIRGLTRLGGSTANATSAGKPAAAAAHKPNAWLCHEPAAAADKIKVALIVSALPLHIGFLATLKSIVGATSNKNLKGEVALVRPAVAAIFTELGHDVEGTKVVWFVLTFGVPTISCAAKK